MRYGSWDDLQNTTHKIIGTPPHDISCLNLSQRDDVGTRFRIRFGNGFFSKKDKLTFFFKR